MKKTFIEVEADYRADGKAIPVSLVHETNTYLIDKVVRITGLLTTKGGGSDDRYEVIINGKTHEIYFEYSNMYTATRRWYRVEEE